MAKLELLIENIDMPEVNNMEIKRVRIKGFKNITDVDITFDNLTALVGLNGYGKSNTMNAIDFGIDFIKYPPRIKTKTMSAKQNIPVLRGCPGRNFELEVEFIATSNQKEYFVEYGYEFSWKKHNASAQIIKEYLKIKANEKGQKYNSYIIRDDTCAKIRRSTTGRCDAVIKIENNNLVINKLTAFDDLFYIDIVNQVNQISFYIERHLDASPSYNPDPFIVKGFEELELNGIQNIPRAIYFLKKEHNDKFKLLINSFRELFPNIVGIDVSEIKLNGKPSIKLSDDAPFVFSDSIYSMVVTDSLLVQPINFENLSDGAKRIFLMLTYAVIADVKGLSIIAIEEPENSIHPRLLQNYLDILSQLLNTCKIVFTSHSPYIIQYLNPRNIYIGMSSVDGSVDFRRISSTKVTAMIKDAETYDKSLGDYIFNLLSSSDSEESLSEYVEAKR
ncbi:MAG: AAA family ATPase [Eubacteriales bacterium]